MKLTAFGIEIELPNPSFPYSRPNTTAQNTHISSGQAIYTARRADIDPQEINLNIEDITAEEHAALSDFIVHVIEFSSHPCRIETDIDAFDDMHLIGGWEQVTSHKGDISTARLRFRQGIRTLAIGKNQIPAPRLYEGGNLASEWTFGRGDGSVQGVRIAAANSPYGYSHHVWQAYMSASDIRAGKATPWIRLGNAVALALVGTDLRITCTYRRTRGNNPLRTTAIFSAQRGSQWSRISEVQAYKQDNTDTGWQVASGVVSESDFPNNANWVIPIVYAGGGRLSSGQNTTLQVAEITLEYTV